MCIDREAQALLIAGDVFDSADSSLKAQLEFIEGLERLDAAGIQSFVCHGNHDPLDGWTARLTFPDSCHRFGPEIGSVSLGDDGRATVYGISYPRRNVTSDLTPHFKRQAADAFAIGLLHANVGTTGHDDYAPCTLNGLTQTGIDYWALGHVHTHNVLNPANPAVVYPGNTQGRHQNETGPRGVCVVDVDGSNRTRIAFVSVCAVRWETANLSIEGLESEGDLIERLVGTAQPLLAESDNCGVVCRITLSGRGPLHATLQRDGTLDTFRELINRALSHQTPFLWCERVIDRTGPEFDREECRQSNDFLGDVLKLIDGLHADPDTLAEIVNAATAPLSSHSKARDYLEKSDLNHARVLANAENRILNHLLRDQ